MEWVDSLKNDTVLETRKENKEAREREEREMDRIKIYFIS